MFLKGYNITLVFCIHHILLLLTVFAMWAIINVTMVLLFAGS